eukprot:TRINITY_DN2604_c0_g1_i9.p1 TRINITY_DN2604_c0_g1~~TRINITY_DN2604_c0_g1_i9.p1  ORF type:complete len:412 (+),score=58.54 TRINITY_DN2604_c0_g1_i9:261-1496(+)
MLTYFLAQSSIRQQNALNFHSLRSRSRNNHFIATTTTKELKKKRSKAAMSGLVASLFGPSQTFVEANHPDFSSLPFVPFPKPHSSWVRDIIQLNDDTLVSCSYDKTVKRWTVKGQLLNSFLGHSVDVFCVMEVDDNTFISGSADLTIKVWNKTTGECLRTVQTTDSIWSLLRLRNNSTFLCGLRDGKMEERSLNNFETLHTLHNHTHAVCSMCEVSSGAVVSASVDATLKVWDMKTKTVIYTMTGHSSGVNKVIELRNTTTVASGSHDQTVCVWDVTTGKRVRVLKGHQNEVFGLVELRDGTLLSGSYSEPMREWDIHKEKCVATYRLMNGVISMTELRDGSIAIGGDVRGEMQVRKTWNTQQISLSQKCCQVIAKHQHRFDMANLKQNLPTELYEKIERCIYYDSFCCDD